MLLRCYNSVNITQQPSANFPLRSKVISMDFLHTYEVVTGWETQTDTATVVIPKNVVLKDTQGNDIALQNLNTSIGGGSNPLFLRGDTISIYAGYWYFDDLGVEQQYVKLLFNGYITKVYSKLSITLSCEDSMYLLKQVPVADQVATPGLSIQDIISGWLQGSTFTNNGGTVKTQSQNAVATGIGTFYTRGETVAQALARMNRELNFSSYIRDNELRIGYPTYWPEDVQNIATPYRGNTNPFKFIFQQNIISDNLQYMRVDDIVVSATAQSFYNSDEGTGTTKDGQAKTRKKKLMVFIWSDPATQSLQSKEITGTDQVPAGRAGQRYTLFFPQAQTVQELINYATNELQKVYYTGFRGSFTTFGMPCIPYGDNIVINDPILPDRNGTYKVKGVTYTGGADIGIRQEIFLDYKISN